MTKVLVSHAADLHGNVARGIRAGQFARLAPACAALLLSSALPGAAWAQAATPPSEPPAVPPEPPPTDAPPADGADNAKDATAPESLEKSPLEARATTKPVEESRGIEIAPAAKPDPDRLRFEVGGRLGYGLATGDVFGGQSMAGAISGVIPLVLDGWLRFPAGFALGLYLQAGIGTKGKDLDGCSDCSIADFRLGLQAAKHFNPYQMFDPWVGAGIGIEALDISRPYYSSLYGNYTIAYVYSAAPELAVQGGLDIGNDKIAFGPYATATWATYSKVSAELRCTGCDDSVQGPSDTIDDTSGHFWFLFGLRGTYIY